MAASQHNPRTARDPRSGDVARTERGLVGFYSACTVFGVAVTISAVVWIVFPEIEELQVLAWIALAIAAVSAVATWHYLAVMRSER
ncbi:MAG: hypothetical protein U1F36_06915 [Planctomycetota bacterium]